jgi:hypothetical protein
MLNCDVNYEKCLGDLSWVLNARLINANKMKSGGDLYGMQACSEYGCWVLAFGALLRVLVRYAIHLISPAGDELS